MAEEVMEQVIKRWEKQLILPSNWRQLKWKEMLPKEEKSNE